MADEIKYGIDAETGKKVPLWSGGRKVDPATGTMETTSELNKRMVREYINAVLFGQKQDPITDNVGFMRLPIGDNTEGELAKNTSIKERLFEWAAPILNAPAPPRPFAPTLAPVGESPETKSEIDNEIAKREAKIQALMKLSEARKMYSVDEEGKLGAPRPD